MDSTHGAQQAKLFTKPVSHPLKHTLADQWGACWVLQPGTSFLCLHIVPAWGGNATPNLFFNFFFVFFSLNLEKSRESCSWLKITWLDCDSHGRSESQQGWNDHQRCVHGRDCRAQADSHNSRLAEGNFLLLLSPSPPRLLPRLPASQSPVSTCCPHPKGWIIIMHTYNTAIWSNKMQMLTLFRQWCSSNATQTSFKNVQQCMKMCK